MRHVHAILGQFPDNSICQQMLAVLQHGQGILSAAMLTQQQELLAACFDEVCEQVRRCMSGKYGQTCSVVQQPFAGAQWSLSHLRPPKGSVLAMCSRWLVSPM